MAPKKGVMGKDAFARMNFLYQAQSLCSSFSSRKAKDVSAYYGSIFRSVAKKAVVRAEPEIKRTLCKGCNSLLIPGENCKVRLRKKPAARLVSTCLRCGTLKRFGVRKDYKIWLERDESVLETLSFSSEAASSSKPNTKQENEIDKQVGLQELSVEYTALSKPDCNNSDSETPVEKTEEFNLSK